MSLLTICSNAILDIGIEDSPVLSAIIGNTTPLAKRVLQQARQAASSLSKRANWSALIVENVFTANGQTAFTLPSDFRSMVNDTLWDRSRYWALRGALSPQQWQVYKSSIIGTATIEQRWRIRIPSGSGAGTSPEFFIDPTIAATDNSTFVYEYVSNNWCRSAGGTPQSDWQADSDTSVLDENLLELGVRWRLMRRLGLSYEEEREEYEREVDKAVARDGGTATLSLVPRRGLQLIGPLNVQEGNFPS